MHPLRRGGLDQAPAMDPRRARGSVLILADFRKRRRRSGAVSTVLANAPHESAERPLHSAVVVTGRGHAL